ncbi:unnamed protein product [Heligmosomoides polygyrus]|uniref:B30.2/SPRY domain-containing protein n=1 Tax=Heligmosomoides polygyrus TaxID=6339 RepID=A0A3P8B046_HELPZ|nr:unnamed protein product [Heligmosomoides polygyrus]
MAKIRRSVALVVEKFAASDVRLLLIVDKKWHIGIFSQCVLPGVGSVIDIEWRYSPATNEITVLSWKKYTGYEPMDRFTVNNTGSATEFTGFFYTTGCVRYNGFPLENPAIFNNYIGIVFDKSKVLNENYIGKYRGIVGAVNQHNTHYITSRYFPYDVRWLSGSNASAIEAASLLGREVVFSARKKDAFLCYVEGDVTPFQGNLRTIFTGSFFAIDIIVEFIGCKDERQRYIVWSDRWEFILDKHDIFVGCDYGLYRIEAIRHFEANDFPRWKATKIHQLVKKIEKSKTRSASSSDNLPTEKLDHLQVFSSSPVAQNVCQPRNLKKTDNLWNPEVTPMRQHSYSEDNLEKTLRVYMHRCLESSEVRAALKEADSTYFKCLVDVLMGV